MKIDVCDLCGKFPVVSLRVRNGETEGDPGGGPSTLVRIHLDLCPLHVEMGLRILITDPSQEERLAKWFTEHKWKGATSDQTP